MIRIKEIFAYAFSLALLFVTATPALAQLKNAAHFSHAVQTPPPYKVGDIIQLAVTVRIDAGYHVYSSVPPKTDANLPTSFKLDPDAKNVLVAGTITERGKLTRKYDAVFEADVAYFDGEATFLVPIRITGTAARIVGYLSYQVCDSNSCINGSYNVDVALAATSPAKVAITQKTSIPDTTPQKADTAQAAARADSSAPTPPSSETSSTPETPWWQLVLTGLGAGLIGLLTPCVYPMVPLTVNIFLKFGATRKQGIRNALIYAASIVVIFTALALLLTLAFGSDFIYRTATNPWVNLFYFALLFVFGISFLGLFEITLPSGFINNIDAQGQKGGISGIFFMALTLVLVSFSCTGPVAGTALVLFSSSNIWGPVLVLFGFSLAFAIPFGLFALFPTWLSSLPKSGGWLNTVKVALGFLELAFALKFLSNADLVWHTGILDREVYLAAWIVLFTLLGFYFLGKLRLPKDAPTAYTSIPSLLLAVCTFWFVLYLIPGLWGAPLKLLSGYLPPVNDEIGVKPAGYVQNFGGGAPLTGTVCNLTDRKYAQELSKNTPPGFCVFYDLEQGLKYAKSVNKPVFIDFTGHTCVNCRQMESNVWPDERVRRKLRDEYVMISLYVDDQTPLDKMVVLPDGTRLRTIGDKWLRYQSEAFQTNAQPYYVLMDSEQHLLAAPRGYNLDVDAYLKFLQMGAATYAKKKAVAQQ